MKLQYVSLGCAVVLSILTACSEGGSGLRDRDRDRGSDDDESDEPDDGNDDNDDDDNDDDDGNDDGNDGDEQCVAADDCADLVYSACTCAPSDPCGWRNDGVCDGDCANVLANPFNDAADCVGGEGEGEGEGEPGGEGEASCTDGLRQQCDAGVVNECTCHRSDPCRWISDGVCDNETCGQFPSSIDDFRDCQPCGPALDDSQCTAYSRLCIDSLCVAPENLTCPGAPAYGSQFLTSAPILINQRFERAVEFDDTCANIGGGDAVIFSANFIRPVIRGTRYPDTTITWNGVTGGGPGSVELSDDTNAYTAVLLCSPSPGTGGIGTPVTLRMFGFNSPDSSNMVCANVVGP